jgi:hypothetical protein
MRQTEKGPSSCFVFKKEIKFENSRKPKSFEYNIFLKIKNNAENSETKYQKFKHRQGITISEVSPTLYLPLTEQTDKSTS